MWHQRRLGRQDQESQSLGHSLGKAWPPLPLLGPYTANWSDGPSSGMLVSGALLPRLGSPTGSLRSYAALES